MNYVNGAEKPCSRGLINIMKWLQAYLLLTIFLCFFGPIEWKIKNPILVVVLLLSYQLALWLGYKSGVGIHYKRVDRVPAISASPRNVRFVSRIIKVGLMADVLMVVRMANTPDPVDIVRKMINGLLSPATRYASYYAEATAGNLLGGGMFSFLVTIISPSAIAGIILGVFFYRELNRSTKSLLWVLIILHIAMKLISAANEGVFDTAIYVIVPAFLRYQNNVACSPEKQRNKWRKRKKWIVLVSLLLIVVVLAFFTSNITGRTKANYAFGTLGENKYRPDAGILNYIPDELEVTLVYLSAYLCQGYYGFSLATMVQWVPMFGMGFSPFVQNNVSSLIGVQLIRNTYQVRITEIADWGALRNYHTAYTFWANDVSLIGVIVVMFILGRMFARYYSKSVYGCSKDAIVLMPLLVTQILYLPANNKIFAQPASFLIVLSLLLHDLLTKKLKRA